MVTGTEDGVESESVLDSGVAGSAGVARILKDKETQDIGPVVDVTGSTHGRTCPFDYAGFIVVFGKVESQFAEAVPIGGGLGTFFGEDVDVVVEGKTVYL